jgi:hypothetical protein
VPNVTVRSGVTGNGGLWEGFRMPARRERSVRDEGPASESLRRTNPRESGEDLAVLWGFGVAAGVARDGVAKIAES